MRIQVLLIADIALFSLGLPLAAPAQEITISPTVGTYFPLAEQQRYPFDFEWQGRPPRTTLVYSRHTSAPVIGVKVAAQWTVLGVEGAVTTAATTRFGYSTYSSAQPSVEWRDAQITTATLRVIGRLQLNDGMDVALGVGPAATQLSGPAYGVSRVSNTHWGGSLMAMLGVTVATRLRAEVSIVDFVYGLGRLAPTQHDFVLSAGVGWVLRPLD